MFVLDLTSLGSGWNIWSTLAESNSIIHDDFIVCDDDSMANLA